MRFKILLIMVLLSSCVFALTFNSIEAGIIDQRYPDQNCYLNKSPGCGGDGRFTIQYGNSPNHLQNHTAGLFKFDFTNETNFINQSIFTYSYQFFQGDMTGYILDLFYSSDDSWSLDSVTWNSMPSLTKEICPDTQNYTDTRAGSTAWNCQNLTEIIQQTQIGDNVLTLIAFLNESNPTHSDGEINENNWSTGGIGVITYAIDSALCTDDINCTDTEFCDGNGNCTTFNLNISATLNNSNPNIYVNWSNETLIDEYDLWKRETVLGFLSEYEYTTTNSTTFDYYDNVISSNSNYSYQVWGVDGFGLLYGKSSWSTIIQTFECYPDEFPSSCDTGFYCSNQTFTCLPSFSGCYNDSDCDSGSFCRNYDQDLPNECLPELNDGELCFIDNQCSNNNCTSTTSTACFFYPNQLDSTCFDGGLCLGFPFEDSYCTLQGVCVNATPCFTDANCTVNQHCKNLAEDTAGACVNDLEDCNEVGNYFCRGDSWCTSDSCVAGLCIDNSTSCNCDGLGCPLGQACNTTNYACYDLSNETSECWLDTDCATDNCMGNVWGAGVCVNTTWECKANYPDLTDPDDYCNCESDKNGDGFPSINDCSDASTGDSRTTDNVYWCNLNNISQIFEDHSCIRKFADGNLCGFDFQCLSNDCIESHCGNTTDTINLEITKLEFINEGDLVTLRAFYTDNGTKIDDANCVWVSDAFDDGTGTYTELPNVYRNDVEVNEVAVNTSFTYRVICSKSDGSDQRQVISDPFLVIDLGEGTTIIETEFIETLPAEIPSNYNNGELDFRVKHYYTANFTNILDATCTLRLRSKAGAFSESYTMSLFDTEYRVTIDVPPPLNYAGAYFYYAYCSGGAGFKTSQEYGFYVIDFDCTNNQLDEGETDIDCGGISCPACESGDDCNLNGDCSSNFCLNGVCVNPSCSDGIWNGNETGTDCGGECDPCMCLKNWDCLQDGSETCNQYECLSDSCSNDSDCDPIEWIDGGTIVYKNRFCDIDGFCKFTENQTNITTNIGLVIIPLSGLVYNSSGNFIYIGNCEANTCGLVLKTSLNTLKDYYMGNSSFSPALPIDSTRIRFGGNTPNNQESYAIPELCFIPPTDDRVYAKIVLSAGIEGSSLNKWDTQTIDFLCFKESLEVNATPERTIDILNFTANRNVSCFYSGKKGENNTLIDEGLSMLLNLTDEDIESFNWLCNTTWGEIRNGKYSIRGFWSFPLLLISLFLPWYEWQSWYWVYVILAIFIILPTTINLFNKRRNER